MLRTAAKIPAVTIQYQEGLFASCPRGNCSYDITNAGLPEVTAVTYDEANGTIEFSLTAHTLEFELTDMQVQVGQFLQAETLVCSNVVQDESTEVYSCDAELNANDTFEIPAGEHTLYVLISYFHASHRSLSIF